MKVNKCEYFQNDTGCCFGQKNAPKCYCDDTDDCTVLDTSKLRSKNKSSGITFKVSAELNWEKICRHIIFTYNLDEKEIGKYLSDNIEDFAIIKVNT